MKAADQTSGFAACGCDIGASSTAICRSQGERPSLSLLLHLRAATFWALPTRHQHLVPANGPPLTSTRAQTLRSADYAHNIMQPLLSTIASSQPRGRPLAQHSALTFWGGSLLPPGILESSMLQNAIRTSFPKVYHGRLQASASLPYGSVRLDTNTHLARAGLT